MSARPFQVGDRVRISGWLPGGPHEGVITEIEPADPAGRFGRYIVTDGRYTSDNGRPTIAVCALTDDGTAGYGCTVELIEPVPDLPQRVRGATLTPSYIDSSPAPVSVDEYRCPVAGCDYMVGAAGPIDPDEPDYLAEDIEAHRASHLDDGRVHDVAEAERMAYDEEAWRAYELLRDGITRQNAQRLAAGPSIIRRVLDAVDAQGADPEGDEHAEPQGEPADISEDDGVSRSRFAPPADVEPYDGGRIPDTISSAS